MAMDVTCERLTLGELGDLIDSEHLARYRFASRFVDGKDVADIACGTDYGTEMLAQNGARRVYGADLSEIAVASCLENHRCANATFSVGNAQSLQAIYDRQFYAVVSFETIEHLVDVESYLD